MGLDDMSLSNYVLFHVITRAYTGNDNLRCWVHNTHGITHQKTFLFTAFCEDRGNGNAKYHTLSGDEVKENIGLNNNQKIKRSSLVTKK